MPMFAKIIEYIKKDYKYNWTRYRCSSMYVVVCLSIQLSSCSNIQSTNVHSISSHSYPVSVS